MIGGVGRAQSFGRCSILFVWWWTVGWESSVVGVAVSGGLCVVVGLLLSVEFACCETQEDQFSKVSRDI